MCPCILVYWVCFQPVRCAWTALSPTRMINEIGSVCHCIQYSTQTRLFNSSRLKLIFQGSNKNELTRILVEREPLIFVLSSSSSSSFTGTVPNSTATTSALLLHANADF